MTDLEPVTDTLGTEVSQTNDQVAMERYIKFLAEERECANMLKWWAERHKAVKNAITGILGDAEVGTVNGTEAVTYRYRNQFNSTEFAKKYPNLYEIYKREQTKIEFDPEWLRTSRPDLYREFQVRTLRVTYTPPGEQG